MSETTPYDHDNLPNSIFSLDSIGPTFDINHHDSERKETSMEAIGHFEAMQHLLEPADARREHGTWSQKYVDGDYLIGKGDLSILDEPDQFQASYMGAPLQGLPEYSGGAVDTASSNPYQLDADLLQQMISDDLMVVTLQALDSTRSWNLRRSSQIILNWTILHQPSLYIVYIHAPYPVLSPPIANKIVVPFEPINVFYNTIHVRWFRSCKSS